MRNFYRLAFYLLPLAVVVYFFIHILEIYYVIIFPRIKELESTGLIYPEIDFSNSIFSTGMRIGVVSYLIGLVILLVLLFLKKRKLIIYLYLVTLSFGIYSLNAVSSSVSSLIPMVSQAVLQQSVKYSPADIFKAVKACGATTCVSEKLPK